MRRWGTKYVIGLTGNIAVGKSVVRQMLQHLGAYTIDADGLVHRAMAPGAPCYRPIIETFGRFILDENKQIDRSALGNIVFSNPQALARLEAITHPVVGQAIDTLIRRSNQRVVVIEAIKLLEGELGQAVDAIWVVDAPPETQLRRLVARRQLPEAAARRRIEAQNAQRDKLARADVVIRNNGDVDATWKQVQAAWAQVQRGFTADPARLTVETPETPRDAAAQTPSQRAAAQSLEVKVRRAMPNNAESIAHFIGRQTGEQISRMDVMLIFGEKSYLLAQSREGEIIGLVGWQVENLITRVDEFYVDPNLHAAPVIETLMAAVEIASRELQSEVCYIFLPLNTDRNMKQSLIGQGYEITAIDSIKVPAWREAAGEKMRDDLQLLSKPLREDRVLRPI